MFSLLFTLSAPQKAALGHPCRSHDSIELIAGPRLTCTWSFRLCWLPNNSTKSWLVAANAAKSWWHQWWQLLEILEKASDGMVSAGQGLFKSYGVPLNPGSIARQRWVFPFCCRPVDLLREINHESETTFFPAVSKPIPGTWWRSPSVFASRGYRCG